MISNSMSDTTAQTALWQPAEFRAVLRAGDPVPQSLRQVRVRFRTRAVLGLDAGAEVVDLNLIDVPDPVPALVPRPDRRAAAELPATGSRLSWFVDAGWIWIPVRGSAKATVVKGDADVSLTLYDGTLSEVCVQFPVAPVISTWRT